jgi:WD40 repeat protein
MRRLLPLLLLILVPAPSAALADGCPPTTCGTTSSAIPGSSVLFVWPHGVPGPLRAFDLERGSRRFSLPSGALSADGRTFVAAAVAAKGARTTVVRYDAKTGKVVRGWSRRGNWQVGGVTAGGSTFVLTRHTRSATTFRVGAEQHVLRGWVDVEAFSPDGRRLYLVQWNRNRYVLQQLDVASGRLAPTRLADPDEKMSGLPATAVVTRDGHWLLTLYWGGENAENFVHALDLRNGVAHCIDLPLSGDFFELGTSSLTLSPDEKTLYLASPYLGRVTTVDLDDLEVTRVVRLRGLPSTSMNLSVGPSAAVTPNGRMLAFSGGRSIWLYDTAYRIAKRVARLDSAVTGLGFSPDGRRLLALQRRDGPVFLDAATGRRAG